jgi:UDP:flavonoid glycosyltransferase YjiC (YdhE family)
VLPAQNEELVDPCVSPVDGSVRIVWVLGTAGTTRGWSCRAAEICRSVCEALQCSGVLVGGDDDERRRFTERFGSGRVIWVEFCPLRALLRRADVVVHHGGIGTSALALEAAVPQVIVPRIFMQPMNAEWLQRMGLCTVIAEREINTSRCIDVLKALFSDPEVRSRAQLLASAEGFRADLSRICDELDRHE